MELISLLMGKKKIIIMMLIVGTFSLSVISANIKQDEIATLTNSVSNKKIGWGIKRNDNHEQPDVGTQNKKILEENKGICLGNKETTQAVFYSLAQIDMRGLLVGN